MKKQNSAIFRKLFHSYVILISVIFVMMLLILIVKDYTGEKQQLERRAQLAAVFDLHQHFAGLVAVCAGTDTQIVSRLRDSELFEKHIGHVGVIVLAGVHDLFFTHAL